MRTERPVVLLVENDDTDVFMFRRALACAGFTGLLKVVAGVTEAVSYLTHCGDHSDPRYNPSPDLIVVDLKLCNGTGTELLQWIKSQPGFDWIPVVMLSGVSTSADRARAHELGAREFYLKSGDIGEMTVRVAHMLENARPKPEEQYEFLRKLQEIPN